MGYFELRRGRADEAVTHFAEAGEPGDAVLRYWLHLFKGRALERADGSTRRSRPTGSHSRTCHMHSPPRRRSRWRSLRIISLTKRPR